ncbi:MAG TPA: DNA repair protein RecO [Candidatus Saccharimonadales bacterium]
MNQRVTRAIILSRTDYGEADRIITLLTPDYGKVTLLAKGVRKVKSKLAGGIELFSVSEITFIKGRGEVGTLVSTRLVKHYEHIVSDLDRTMLAYELLKRLNKVTESEVEEEYFALLQGALEALNDLSVSLDLIRFWFDAQLLRLGGQGPNLQTDEHGSPLSPEQQYTFDFERMGFMAAPHGQFDAQHIKFLRLAFAGHSALALAKVQGGTKLAGECTPMLHHLMQLAF